VYFRLVPIPRLVAFRPHFPQPSILGSGAANDGGDMEETESAECSIAHIVIASPSRQWGLSTRKMTHQVEIHLNIVMVLLQTPHSRP
jgi:hypothetical protein